MNEQDERGALTEDEIVTIAAQFEGRCFDYQGFARAIERQARAASTPANVAQGAEAVLPAWFDVFLTNVCEIPDRNSPDDEPEAIVATLEELKSCALNAIEQCALPAQTAPTDDARDLFIRDIAQQKPEKPDHWNSCRQCEHNIERAQDILTAAQSASGDTK